MKKRSFIFLEILIALSLISIFSIFIVTNPIYIYRKELLELEKLEEERIRREAFFEIREKLFKNKIPWNSFSKDKKSDAEINFLYKKRLEIGKILKKDLPIYYRIWTDKEKKKRNNIYRRINIEIFINNKKNSPPYILFCQKIMSDR